MTAFDPTRLVVLGESLAAGLVNFSLHADDQLRAFPQLVAKQLGTTMPAPLFRAPGVGEAAGFQKVPVYAPEASAEALLVDAAAADTWRNLSVPGLTLDDATARRPAAPLVHPDDARQTALNLVLGAQRTQLDHALALKPTLAIVELGFADVMEAAASASASSMLADSAFRDCYARVVSSLRNAGADVVVTTVPDPMDTAYFSTLDAAARVLKMAASELSKDYGLQSGDRITANGLVEIGVQIMEKRVLPLQKGHTLGAAAATTISAKVQAMNAAIAAVAKEHGAAVADFAGVYRKVQNEGLPAGSRQLTGDFLGGFFSLNGYTPGAAGQAALANTVTDAIGKAAGRTITPIDLRAVAASDPVADYRPVEGPPYRTLAGQLAALRAGMSLAWFLVNFVAKAVIGAINRKKEPRRPEQGNTPDRWTLKLPPKLTQTLPIDSRSSYYGDALTPIHTTDAEEQRLGLSGRTLFAGYGLLDSRLKGKVRITFAPPVNNVAHFEITHPGTLKGENTRLAAPVFYRLAGVANQIMDSTSLVSSGNLNLVTGEVTNLTYTVFLLNSAILALAAVTPALPKDPIAFPGMWGATWARFDQRTDGLLDYTCYCYSFIPLSVLRAPVRFPLPFTGPSGSVASIPADGTALHPHFSISTRPPATIAGAGKLRVPTNVVREVTTAAGRLRIQYGENFGSAVSVVAMPLPPAVSPADPVNDDRLNLSVGAIDAESGTLMPQACSRITRLTF